MASFLSLPPEVRTMIYHLLIQEATAENKRAGVILDGPPGEQFMQYLSLEHGCCKRYRPQGPYDFQGLVWKAPMTHCVRSSAALAVARTSKLLYHEIVPHIWRNADLSVQGASSGVAFSLLYVLELLSTTAIANIEHLNIVIFNDGESSVVRELKPLVNAINQRLHNLKTVKLSISGAIAENSPSHPSTILMGIANLADVGVLMLIPSHISVSLSNHPATNIHVVWSEYFRDDSVLGDILDASTIAMETTVHRLRNLAIERQTRRDSDNLGKVLEDTQDLRRAPLGLLSHSNY
ncbi:hypothetical protein E4T42_05677 [Aureobasidium subglaciale]|nr:hypothetical protein E4T42_05677 [Aureobasidium subglaciale]